MIFEDSKKNLLSFFSNQKKSKLKTRLSLTILLLSLIRFGNTLPLANIDQEALQKTLLEFGMSNPLIQTINMYTTGGTSKLTLFSLGISPYINASIIVDLVVNLNPSLQKLQSEEGEIGRQQIKFYKKILNLFIALIEGLVIVNLLKPYCYNTDIFQLGLIILQLVTGSFIMIWISDFIDKKGFGNGTSILILSNIIISALNQIPNLVNTIRLESLGEITFVLSILTAIIIAQKITFNIPIISARQSAFLTKSEGNLISEKLGISLKLWQAGIFPIIIASSLLPFLSFFSKTIQFGSENIKEIIIKLIFYFLIVIFSKIYTKIYWDPEKISEQLRKASVSIIDVTPGQETTKYLDNFVELNSTLGGYALCFILIIFDIVKVITNSYLLNHLSISSLIIVIQILADLLRKAKDLIKLEKTQKLSESL